MVKTAGSSIESIAKATRSVVNFSGHGAALGASGYREASRHPANCEFLEHPGQSIAVTPGSKGFESMMIGVAWDPMYKQNQGLFGRWFKTTRKINVDLDIGCLYELKDGTRGAIQAFGNKYGSYDKPPYMQLSGDERTGDKDGHDEYILINGFKWDEIKRMLAYIYIYEGAARWSEINPQLVIDVPGENDLYVTLDAFDDKLCICAVGEIENVRGGIRLTNRTEYFPGHEEMDRAFGFGLKWADGKKDPL